MNEVTIYEKKDHIAFVTINRPEARNSYNDQAHGELSSIWKDVRADRNVWAVVLTGAGREAFCAGRDVKELSEYQKKGKLVPRYDPEHPNYKVFGHLADYDINKPVIGAINGFVVGGGAVFFFGCDMRVMSEDAWIGDLHAAIGQVGGTELFAQHMPVAIASELVYTKHRLDAKRAYELGLVNKVVPYEQVLPEATKLAEAVCEMSPLAVQRSKEVMRTTRSIPEGAVRLSKHYAIAMRQTEDGKEGPLAFKEKRKPQWTGK